MRGLGGPALAILPPTVESVLINDGHAQQSMVTLLLSADHHAIELGFRHHARAACMNQ